MAHFPEFKEVAKFLKNIHIIRFFAGFLQNRSANLLPGSRTIGRSL
jgi:hypothetical protein